MIPAATPVGQMFVHHGYESFAAGWFDEVDEFMNDDVINAANEQVALGSTTDLGADPFVVDALLTALSKLSSTTSAQIAR